MAREASDVGGVIPHRPGDRAWDGEEEGAVCPEGSADLYENPDGVVHVLEDVLGKNAVEAARSKGEVPGVGDDKGAGVTVWWCDMVDVDDELPVAGGARPPSTDVEDAPLRQPVEADFNEGITPCACGGISCGVGGSHGGV